MPALTGVSRWPQGWPGRSPPPRRTKAAPRPPPACRSHSLAGFPGSPASRSRSAGGSVEAVLLPLPRQATQEHVHAPCCRVPPAPPSSQSTQGCNPHTHHVSIRAGVGEHDPGASALVLAGASHLEPPCIQAIGAAVQAVVARIGSQLVGGAIQAEGGACNASTHPAQRGPHLRVAAVLRVATSGGNKVGEAVSWAVLRSLRSRRALREVPPLTTHWHHHAPGTSLHHPSPAPHLPAPPVRPAPGGAAGWPLQVDGGTGG